MRTYTVRYVHKISPRESDTCDVNLPDTAFSDRKTLANALRRALVLAPGTRLRSMRVEGGRTVAFPDRGIWHSVIIAAA